MTTATGFRSTLGPRHNCKLRVFLHRVLTTQINGSRVTLWDTVIMDHTLKNISQNHKTRWNINIKSQAHYNQRLIFSSSVLASFRGKLTSHCFFQTFPGNTDQNNVVTHELVPPIQAQYIRVIPESWHNFVSLRLEFYGCLASKHSARFILFYLLWKFSLYRALFLVLTSRP